MKYKRITYLLLIFSITLSFIGCTNKKSTEEKQEGYAKYINLTDFSFVLDDDGVSYKIKGNVTNNYSKEFAYVSILLDFYNNDKVIKTDTISTSDLKPQETKEFSHIILNKYKDLPYKLRVDFAVLSDE